MTRTEPSPQPDATAPATGRTEPGGLWTHLAARRVALVEDGPSLWEHLDRRLHRARARPRLRRDLVVSRQEDGGAFYYVIKDPVALTYYRFKENEYFILTLLDGDHEVRDLVMAYAERYRPIRPATVQGFLERVESFGLLEQGRHDLYGLIKARLASSSVASRLGALLRLNYALPDTDAWTQRLYHRLRWLFRPLLGAAAVSFAASGLLLIALAWDAFVAGLAAVLDSGPGLAGYGLALYAALIGVTIVHELAHALTCVHYGGRVHKMGVMFYYVTLAAYADTSDAWLFPERRHRAWVSLAGPLSTLVFAALGAWAWWLAPAGSLWSRLALMLVLATAPLTFANLNPFLEYDGYYVLSDLTGIPNLRRRSFEHCRQRLARLVRAAGPLPALPVRQRRIFAAYGLLAAAYFVAFLAVPLALQVPRLLQKHGPLAGGLLAGLLLLLAGQRPLRALYRRWRSTKETR